MQTLQPTQESAGRGSASYHTNFQTKISPPRKITSGAAHNFEHNQDFSGKENQVGRKHSKHLYIKISIQDSLTLSRYIKIWYLSLSESFPAVCAGAHKRQGHVMSALTTSKCFTHAGFPSRNKQFKQHLSQNITCHQTEMSPLRPCMKLRATTPLGVTLITDHSFEGPAKPVSPPSWRIEKEVRGSQKRNGFQGAAAPPPRSRRFLKGSEEPDGRHEEPVALKEPKALEGDCERSGRLAAPRLAAPFPARG